MSPRAAWRLETLGFQRVLDYVGGKADWLAHGLPTEGESARGPYAGELVDSNPPTCGLGDHIAEVRAVMDAARQGFCVVLNDRRIVLGRVARSALQGVDPAATAEEVMEAGPSTVRPSTNARELVERLASRHLAAAIVTTPEGSLIGTFHREDAQVRHPGGV